MWFMQYFNYAIVRPNYKTTKYCQLQLNEVTAGGAAGAGADEDVHQTVHGPLQVTLQDT